MSLAADLALCRGEAHSSTISDLAVDIHISHSCLSSEIDQCNQNYGKLQSFETQNEVLTFPPPRLRSSVNLTAPCHLQFDESGRAEQAKKSQEMTLDLQSLDDHRSNDTCRSHEVLAHKNEKFQTVSSPPRTLAQP